MNADLTINSIVFAKSFDTAEGSERRSTSRGINTPDVMLIKKQDAVDSKTKQNTKRYLMRFDRVAIDSVTGVAYTTSAYLTIVVPALATSTDTDAIVATARAAIAATSPNYITQLLNSES